MKRYQLPDVLGGGVIEANEIWGGCAGGRPEYELGNGMTIIAPAGQPFGEVAPPLPPEPPVGSVVLFGGEAVQRFEDNELADDPSAHWASVGWSGRWTWEGLVEINSPPVLLVPAPEPVELPWQLFDGVKVAPLVGCGCFEGQEDGVRMVRVEMDAPTNLLPGEAREFAWALLAAADAAEAAS